MPRVELGTIVITGGASGLGAAAAEAVSEAGGTPVVVNLQPGPDWCEYEQLDLADGRAAEAAVGAIAERHGGLDGLVAAAGIDACGEIGDVDPQAWERVIAVNLLGTVAVVRAALPHLEGRRGRVVTVASTLGFRALPAATAYCASKFGVVGFTRALAAETAGRIGVTLLVPGGMATSFFDGRDERFLPAADAQLNRPEDVAQSIVFALSQPIGCEVRELVVCPAVEPSWP